MTHVSFPGIFGDKVFTIDPVIFPGENFLPDFPLQIRWYGLIICLAIILSVLNTIRCAKKEGITTDDILDYALWTIPIGIIGARAYYVLTSLSDYKSFYDVIAIWEGGLAIYGGIIAGALTVFAVSMVKKIKFTKIADSIATSLFIGQAIGRWGNFCNGEAFGHLDRIEFLGIKIPTPFFEEFFLRMQVTSSSTGGVPIMVHPTFLYESLWNILGFIVVTLIYRKKKFDGQIMFCYFAWYGLGRFFIEGLRSDSLYLFADIKISQLLALVTFVFSVAAIIFFAVRKKHTLKDEVEYTNMFSTESDEATEAADMGGAEAVNEAEATDTTTKISKKIESTSDKTEEQDNGNNN